MKKYFPHERAWCILNLCNPSYINDKNIKCSGNFISILWVCFVFVFNIITGSLQNDKEGLIS